MKKIYYDGSNKSIKRIAEILNTKPEVGENHEDAYYGDYGKTAYLHSQLQSGNPHNVTAADLGLDGISNRLSLLESEYIALEARVEALERGQGGGDDKPFIIKRKNGVLQYNTVYLNDVYTVWNDDYFTQKRLEHLQNGELLYGGGTDWKISNCALQPVGVDYFRGLTFTQPITLTNETTFKLRYSYSSRNQWSKSHFSFWENADPSSVLPTQMGIGDLVTSTDYTWIVHENSPSSLAETTVIKDVTALQGKTVWILIYAQQITPLITGIWFE